MKTKLSYHTDREEVTDKVTGHSFVFDVLGAETEIEHMAVIHSFMDYAEQQGFKFTEDKRGSFEFFYTEGTPEAYCCCFCFVESKEAKEKIKGIYKEWETTVKL